ncbi:MAG: glutathione synthetase, partial [Varibaculum cambriense]|nr:glutathione synthetase [Varibaculum cambriense]
AIHRMIKQRLGHDQQLLFLRIDIVPDGKGSYYLMEVSPVDGSLYLRTREDGIATFADAICNRVFW